MRLFCDYKTDEEKSNFFLSGDAVETGVIAPAISNDVAMAYHRCAQLKKENDALRAKIESMELECDALRAMIQEALVVLDEVSGNINPERGYADELEADIEHAIATIALPGAKGE